jgi:hypothetical protein
MKKLFLINEDEKNRILNLHENATKRQYLGEQETAPADTTRVATNRPPSTQGQAVAMGQTSRRIQTQTPKSNQTNTTSKQYGVNYIKMAQQLLGVTADGKFGPKTLAALQSKLNVNTGGQPDVEPQTETPTSGAQQGVTTGEVSQTGPPPSSVEPKQGSAQGGGDIDSRNV